MTAIYQILRWHLKRKNPICRSGENKDSGFTKALFAFLAELLGLSQDTDVHGTKSVSLRTQAVDTV